MSLIEKGIAAVSPGWAAKRAADRAALEIMAAGYDGATSSRKRKGWANTRSMEIDEDRHVGAWDLSKLRLECRDLVRNSAMVSGVVSRFADNVVGAGIYPQAKTSDDDWNTSAEQFWREWSKVCDFRQRINMRELQRLAIRQRMSDGDLGLILLKNGQVMPVEAERLAGPKEANAINGVQVSGQGLATHFWVSPRDDRGRPDCERASRIASDNFVFLANKTRFDQVRGIPDLAPVINGIRDFDELHEAVINKAKLDAFRAYAIKSDGGSSMPGNASPRNAQPDPDANQQQVEYNDWGMIYHLDKGEDIDPLYSSNPNPSLVPYSELILRLIGSSLSIPLEFLMLDFSKTSFSSSRAALMQAYAAFDNQGMWLRDSALQRLWNWRIAKAIKDGQLAPAPRDSRGASEWYKTEWAFPSRDFLDPVKEATAKAREYSLGTSSLTEMAKRRGRDAGDILAEKGADIATAMEVAAAVQQQTGQAVRWQDLINTNPLAPIAPGVTQPDAPAQGE